MRILWLCPLIQHPTRANVWLPALLPLRDGPTGNFACEWSSTDVQRAAPYAVGSAEVTSEQLDVINATANIQVVEEDQWSTQFRDLPATRRTRLNQFYTSIGEVRPGTTEMPMDFMQRLAQLVDGKTVEVHLERLAAKRATTRP